MMIWLYVGLWFIGFLTVSFLVGLGSEDIEDLPSATILVPVFWPIILPIVLFILLPAFGMMELGSKIAKRALGK